MFLAAVLAAFALHSLNTCNMQAAPSTLHHVQGFGRCGWWCWMIQTCLPAAPEPDTGKDHRQDKERFHSVRPRITSMTKREPTYASNSSPEPKYSTRIAFLPRQPNRNRPTISTAKVTQDSSEKMVL